MYKKIQNYGLNKKVFNDQVEHVAIEALKKDENQVNEHKELLRAFVEVSLYGWDKITKDEFKPDTVKNMRSFFGDLRKFDEISFKYKSDPKFAIKKNLERMDKLFWYLQNYQRAEVTNQEQSYQETINNFEGFLQNYYEDELLPALEDEEENIREELLAIFALDISEEEKIERAEAFLAESEERLTVKFDQQENGMSEVAVATALAILAILSIPEPTEADVQRYKGIFKKGYLSNIKGNLYTWYRQINEMFFDTVSLQRSTEREAIRNISVMNRNKFKLSVVSHPRALFRAISNKQAIKEGFTHFKALVPEWSLATLNPNGTTRKYLYMIKTPEEWKTLPEATTPNVVDGLSLHHNDQIFYMPVENNDEQIAISKEQRKELT